ncbi:hypothetical protein SDC9_164164 [bioreactor metagenome]|uniref:Uncharacterized protein n=1 Tax=bioreactor metagenome TaxID=1076179 RepID=A0A645FQW3_9ZZZZ
MGNHAVQTDAPFQAHIEKERCDDSLVPVGALLRIMRADDGEAAGDDLAAEPLLLRRSGVGHQDQFAESPDGFERVLKNPGIPGCLDNNSGKFAAADFRQLPVAVADRFGQLDKVSGVRQIVETIGDRIDHHHLRRAGGIRPAGGELADQARADHGDFVAQLVLGNPGSHRGDLGEG